MDKDEHIARLRARRQRIEAFERALESIREVETSLQEMRELLTEQLKFQRSARLADIRDADEAGVPKTKISKEVGLSRARLYVDLNKPVSGDK
ncbi:hypothetical protein FPZ12_020310 [Amycolatopsis acidicola]|uniref:Uncharacterized protein n=1 Tax=Amycolatopsis acidicola TaxID=2596893 RepID=A0A5N0UZI0_9PSEU|nr:hypothetical protein [Amycolatopsis acidicola]KAA9159448.1 hypothetical protein FPZ12_020310 [Amycolatopsis acidicola]